MPYLLLVLFLTSFAWQAEAAPLPFHQFLDAFLAQDGQALQARRQLINAENQKIQGSDLWRSRLEVIPSVNFTDQNFENNPANSSSFRNTNISGNITQQLPYGTQLRLEGLKNLEVPNIVQFNLDRRYSASITQDLFRNAFGESQRRQRAKAIEDYSIQQLESRQTLVDACERAFRIYTDAFQRQEQIALLASQLEDAKKALKISRRLFRDKLITPVDKLSSESDFINTELDFKRAQQELINSKRQITSFMPEQNPNFGLVTPEAYTSHSVDRSVATLNEVLSEKRVDSQGFEVDRLASERRTDVQLSLTAEEREGRFNNAGFVAGYNEQALTANVTFGFDLVNNTENSQLNAAIQTKNNLVVAKEGLKITQKAVVQNLVELGSILELQKKRQTEQVKLLQEKMKLAFQQMRRAKLDFETYLLHRNAYLNQKLQLLQLQTDLWRNQFSLHKEYAHREPQFCQVKI